MSKGKEPTTIQSVLRRLSPTEQQIICNSLNVSKNTNEYHRGMLPFVKLTEAAEALHQTYSNGEKRRLHAKIIEKILKKGNSVSFFMYLSPYKVGRQFGENPEIGVRIPGATPKRVSVGMRWSLPKQCNVVDDNVYVMPHVSLKLAKAISGLCGRYIVTVEKKHRTIASQWLSDTCG